MVAALKPDPPTLPLLAEPLKPDDRAPKAWGWTAETTWRGRYVRGEGLPRMVRTMVRNPSHDAMGAFVQHVVVRYIVHGVSREQIARETGYSERQVQSWIQGRAYEPYTRAVLKVLGGMGIGLRRGLRPHRYTGLVTRADQIVMAQQHVLERVVPLLDLMADEGTQQLVANARLLLAGREPVKAP